MPFRTHHAAVLVCCIAVAVAASPLLFGSRPSLVRDESSGPNGDPIIDQSTTGVPSDSPKAPSGSARLHVQQVEKVISDMNILFVMDPNFFLCWESILIDETTRGLLAWVSSLKDPFTRSSESPAGLDLGVRHEPYSTCATCRGCSWVERLCKDCSGATGFGIRPYTENKAHVRRVNYWTLHAAPGQAAYSARIARHSREDLQTYYRHTPLAGQRKHLHAIQFGTHVSSCHVRL